MPKDSELIEDWFQTHFSHVTPGTPDHFTLVRAKADLIARLAEPKKPAKSDQPAS